HGYLAAPDKDRLADFHGALRNKKVKAIFFLRGGYGTLRLLPEIDYGLIEKNPKIIVGYSDATSFIGAIYKKTGLRSMFFGPMPAVDIWNGFDQFAEQHFWQTLTSNVGGEQLPMSEAEGIVLKKGRVTSRVVGGNLTVWSSLFGTPYMPSLHNKALFFEDIDERPYKIDRYFAQMRVSGELAKITGVLLGQFAGCEPEEGKPSLTLDQVFIDYFSKLKVPVVTNLPFGHVQRQWTMPYGAKYDIDARKDRATITIAESPLL
ncbi:MAG TPA: LD-carboxypeptidase, partial [Candidatus Kapabacteria bacterium]|nr:LD-carboxypeptidase [Candidatus Kapabacteria bacterium]